MTQLQQLTGPYSFMNRTVDGVAVYGDIWWRADNDGVTIWGFQPGEEAAPAGDDWQHEEQYVYRIKDEKNKDTGLYPDLINTLYYNDPDQYMYWPLFNTLLTGSQGYLVNDYKY